MPASCTDLELARWQRGWGWGELSRLTGPGAATSHRGHRGALILLARLLRVLPNPTHIHRSHCGDHPCWSLQKAVPQDPPRSLENGGSSSPRDERLAKAGPWPLYLQVVFLSCAHKQGPPPTENP